MEPENMPAKTLVKARPRPARDITQEAKLVKKHQEPASSAGCKGDANFASTGPGAAKTMPKMPPATEPL
eukprot:CAMPEP_0206435170 /NCGR_PEP_ID=MMETSP0324_2-20121206/9667_1 /ASSEMBLY_ACC=CAM_ASM_000836 /TAXON_ID=2866 /ORGANISM="Crypthecodinium cohnii, Strain Seligo" /LENGTH=68 /DNA_ID=CAMNT_0053901971 /DNA_START=205 /DNA_END=411 /DNA_ORIENTATION=+